MIGRFQNESDHFKTESVIGIGQNMHSFTRNFFAFWGYVLWFSGLTIAAFCVFGFVAVVGYRDLMTSLNLSFAPGIALIGFGALIGGSAGQLGRRLLVKATRK